MTEPKTIDFFKEVKETPAIEGEVLEKETVDKEDTGGQLVVIANNVERNALTILSTENGLDPFIEEIKSRVKSEVFDISTEEGRLRIGSVARQIGSAKQKMVKIAEKTSEDAKKIVETVRKERLRMERELDGLRDEIKEPLEKWKEAEEVRKAQHETDILDIERAAAGSWADMSLEELQTRRDSVEKKFNGKEWQEFVHRAEQARNSTISILDDGIAKRKKYDEEQAELAEARRKQEEALQKENDRKNAHVKALEEIGQISEISWSDYTVDQIEAQIKLLDPYRSRAWEEYAETAKATIATAEEALLKERAGRIQNDEQQAELEQRRKDEVENKRKAAIAEKLTDLRTLALFSYEPTVTEIVVRQNNVETFRNFDWQELKEEAEQAISQVLESLKNAKEAAQERLDKAIEAAESARKNSLMAAILEVKQLGAFLEQPKTTKEIDVRIDALDKFRTKDWQEFEDDAHAAIIAVANVLEKALDDMQERASAATRKSNEDHKKKVEAEILKVLMETVTTGEEQLKTIIKAISQGKVPNVTITY